MKNLKEMEDSITAAEAKTLTDAGYAVVIYPDKGFFLRKGGKYFEKNRDIWVYIKKKGKWERRKDVYKSYEQAIACLVTKKMK